MGSATGWEGGKEQKLEETRFRFEPIFWQLQRLRRAKRRPGKGSGPEAEQKKQTQRE